MALGEAAPEGEPVPLRVDLATGEGMAGGVALPLPLALPVFEAEAPTLSVGL